MLQPSQIQDISVRYAAEIAEVRAFLRRAGTPVETGTALHAMVERLATDASFHRDLGSHAWMLLYAGATVPEVLQVLAVAAAGVTEAGEADEDDAHEVLRFVMDSRRSMATRMPDRPSSSRSVAANPPGTTAATTIPASPAATIPIETPTAAQAAVRATPAGVLEQAPLQDGGDGSPLIPRAAELPAQPRAYPAEPLAHPAEPAAAPFSGAFRFSRAATLPHAERTEPVHRTEPVSRAAPASAEGEHASPRGDVPGNTSATVSAATGSSAFADGAPHAGPVSAPQVDPAVAQDESSIVDQPLPKRSVRSDEAAVQPRRKWLALVAVCAVLLGLGGVWLYQRNADDGADVRGPAVPVEQNAVQPGLQSSTQTERPQFPPYALPEISPGRAQSLTAHPAYDTRRAAPPRLPKETSETSGTEQAGAVSSAGTASGSSYAATPAPAPIVRMPGTASASSSPRLAYRPSTTTGGRSIVQPIPSAVLSSRLDSPSSNDADAVDNRVEGTRGYPRLLRRQQLDANGTLMASMSAPPVTAGGNVRNVSLPSGTVRSTALGISAGNLVYAPDPAYPSVAASQHVSGQVTVQAMVDRDGNVASARVVSGPPLLRDAAVNAVQQWRYRPFLAGGKPQTFTATAIMDFQLK